MIGMELRIASVRKGVTASGMEMRTAVLAKLLSLFLGGLVGMLPVLAQESAAVGLTKEKVEAAMTQAATLEGLTEEAQGKINSEYESALNSLSQAAASAAAAEEFSKAVDRAPEETKVLLAKMEAMKMPDDALSLVSVEERSVSPDELSSLLSREEVALEEQRVELDKVKARLIDAEGRLEGLAEEEGRVKEEVASATAELRSLSELELGAFPMKDAQRVRLQAVKIAGEAKLTELAQERLGLPSELKLLSAKRDLRSREIELGQERVEVLRQLVREGVSELAQKAFATAREMRAGGGSEQQADELEALARELEKAIYDLARVEKSVSKQREKLEMLKGDYELRLKQVEASDGGDGFAQALLDQQSKLEDPNRVKREMKQAGKLASDARLARLQVERLLLGVEDSDGAVRLSVLQELSGRYAALIQKYGELEVVKQEYVVALEDFDRLFVEKLFWVRSSPSLSADTFKDLPEGFNWLFASGRGGELAKGFSGIWRRDSLKLGVLGLLAVVLLVLRPRFRNRMKSHLVSIRAVALDEYRNTLEAMGFTLLISVPFSLLMWVLGRQLFSDLEASEWVQGLAEGVMTMAPILFGFIFVRELCRPEGVVESHFRWKKPALKLLRRVVSNIAIVYVPMGVLLTMLFAEPSGQYVHSLGRVLFVLTMLWVAYWVSVLLHPAKGIPAGEIKREPGSWLGRLKFLWYPLAILLPIALAGLALSGYLITALTLNNYLKGSVAIIVGAILLYSLLLRWFTIRERKLALEKRLQERKEKREAAEKAGEEIAVGEEAGLLDEDEIDLVQVGVQTRRLLKALVVSGVIAALWFVWAEALPALRSLDASPVIGAATWADLLLGLLVVIATTIVAKNLPGILEIAVLQNLPIDSGSRYAAASLAQYAIVAIGGVLLFQVLPLDWSQLGWAFAALSVGLGFGLQEIVANFVCGIILLFERPIRVGDVVTISNVTGTVSKIRMRATTITDWDRKEFVVPNKEFITGQLLNWTLSNTTNRIVINIGVAYGSDIVKVQEVLMEVLKGHSDLMEDPGPVVTFGNFGDSSLDFTIRCYLPNLDRRLGVTHELYSEIYRRLEEENIEIPFPQRDLHLRSDASKA